MHDTKTSASRWRERLQSMPFVLAMACLLLALAVAVPLHSSLGQGVDEVVVVGWRGVHDQSTGTYAVRILHADGSFVDSPLPRVASRLFTRSSGAGMRMTPDDLPFLLILAYKTDPRTLESALGTYGNAASFFSPFPTYPVAYSAGFLRALALRKFNPERVGGPDIPPGSVPLTRLSGGMLPVDTGSDANTIVQCQPGEMPPALRRML